jgi:hypothetical protein
MVPLLADHLGKAVIRWLMIGLSPGLASGQVFPYNNKQTK